MGRTAARGRGSLVRHAVVLGCAALAGLVAAVTAPAPGELAAESSPTSRPPPSAATHPGRPAQVRLVVHADPDGTIDTAVVVGAAQGADDATAVLLAPSTLLEVPSLGGQTLAEVGRLRDPAVLELAVENALGIALDGVDVLDDARLTAALAPAETLDVDLHRAIEITDERGTLTFGEGHQTISSADAMRLLTAENDAGEPDQLVVVQALLEGWLARLQGRGVAHETESADPVAAALVRVAGGDVRFVALPVERLTASTEEELFGLDRDEVRGTMGRAFPWALFNGGEPRPRVELLNGTGGVGVTLDVAQQVVPAGGEVTLTGNVPGFGVGETVVVYYRDEGRAAAEMLLEALGAGRLAVADQPLGVIDVSVVIGSDLVPLADQPADTTPADGTATPKEPTTVA